MAADRARSSRVSRRRAGRSRVRRRRADHAARDVERAVLSQLLADGWRGERQNLTLVDLVDLGKRLLLARVEHGAVLEQRVGNGERAGRDARLTRFGLALPAVGQ